MKQNHQQAWFLSAHNKTWCWFTSSEVSLVFPLTCSCSTTRTSCAFFWLQSALCVFVLEVGLCVFPGEISLATLRGQTGGTIIPLATVHSWLTIGRNNTSHPDHSNTPCFCDCEGFKTNSEPIYKECWVGPHLILLRRDDGACGKMC